MFFSCFRPPYVTLQTIVLLMLKFVSRCRISCQGRGTCKSHSADAPTFTDYWYTPANMNYLIFWIYVTYMKQFDNIDNFMFWQEYQRRVWLKHPVLDLVSQLNLTLPHDFVYIRPIDILSFLSTRPERIFISQYRFGLTSDLDSSGRIQH